MVNEGRLCEQRALLGRGSVVLLGQDTRAVRRFKAKKLFSYMRCYSCASSEYKPIFEKSDMLASSSSVPQFDRFCDIEDSVQAIAPVESCESSCITIFEPQYFGGVFMRHERV
ncbi:hypothetical protein TELCIR_04091 [Teladorsagia circumcincta]|uniref:Uncharacterized protein n=1 Tax=Teladorsagia circumcincta TaxID=45464 RepID=A0A2G9UUL6_TELCI|nr:hypothetical protein TELCIR_04091 [Teladorsagia circumcincta]